MAEGRDERETEELDIALGMTAGPEQEALEALRKHQEAAGMTFEDPGAPVMAPDGGDRIPAWMTRDEEVR